MNDLLPCPFCGSKARMLHLSELPEDDPNFGGWYIECDNATCRATTNIHFGEAERPLREKWNRRVDRVFACKTCHDTGEVVYRPPDDYPETIACPDCGFPKDEGYGVPSA